MHTFEAHDWLGVLVLAEDPLQVALVAVLHAVEDPREDTHAERGPQQSRVRVGVAENVLQAHWDRAVRVDRIPTCISLSLLH